MVVDVGGVVIVVPMLLFEHGGFGIVFVVGWCWCLEGLLLVGVVFVLLSLLGVVGFVGGG